MQTLYDSAGMAIVAYGEVLADGTSPNQNSGVLTARTGPGQYTITLPTNIVAGGAKNLAQSGSCDSLIISPKVIPATGVPVSHSVDDSDPAVKRVAIYGGSPLQTFASCAFNFILFRTIVTPPQTIPPTPG
jgi:hypothetical protein